MFSERGFYLGANFGKMKIWPAYRDVSCFFYSDVKTLRM